MRYLLSLMLIGLLTSPLLAKDPEPAGFYSASRRPAGADAWNVPGDVPEMMQKCLDIPALYNASRSGYFSIECGYQAILFNGDVPIANAPHVGWAKPLAKPLRLLVFAQFGNSPADYYQVAQLCRELDCSARMVLIACTPLSHESLKDDAYRVGFLAEQAREALKDDYDAIVFAMGSYSPQHGYPFRTDVFPEDVFQSVLTKVKGGTGLVLVGSNIGGWWVNKTPLTEAAPAVYTGGWRTVKTTCDIRPAEGDATFAGLPTYDLVNYAVWKWKLKDGATVLATESGEPYVIGGTYGQGRTLIFGYDGTLAPVMSRDERPLGFGHGMAWAIRGISWAARALPPVQVTPVDATFPAGAGHDVPVAVSGKARLEATLKTLDNRTLWQGTTPEGATAVSLPAIPAGLYALDIVARGSKGESLGYGGCQVTATAAATMTVTADPEVAKVGGTVTIRAAGKELPAGATARAVIRDAAGRVVSAGPMAADGQDFVYRYAVQDARVAPHTAEVTVYDHDQALLRESADFFVPSYAWPDYLNVLWPGATSEMNVKMRDVGGIGAVMDGWGRSDMSAAGARAGILPARMNDGCVDPKSMSLDPVAGITKFDYVIKPAIEAARKYGSVTWAFQDERGGRDPGMPGEAGLLAFQTYLKGVYGSLDKLNAEWDSTYAKWEDVKPMLMSEITPETRNLAPWVDARLCAADYGFQADKRHADMVHGAFGQAVPVGIDGFTSSGHVIPFGATDIGRLLSTGTFNSYCPYGDDLMIAAMVTGPMVKYIGWGMSRRDYFGQPWRDVFRGHWGTFRFFGPTLYSQFGWMQPAGRWCGEGTAELRAGTGKLLMGAKRQLDPVVFLYSYPSMMTVAGAGSWVEKQNGHLMWRPANWSRNAWEEMVVGCGNSFGYLTEAQVQQGQLKGRKLLIVSHFMGMALSPETCRAIEAFVADGGMVVADLAPAVCDGHGKLLAEGGLDKLFGISHDGFTYGQRTSDYLVGVTERDPQTRAAGMELGLNAWYVGEWYEKTLKVTDGLALGKHWFTEIPAMVVKHTGNGQTVLLNFLHTSTVRRNGSPEEEEYKLMSQLLAMAGVKPQARIETDFGQTERFAEINTLRDGANTYVGVFAKRSADEDPSRLVIRFDDARETYDVRQGKYLGKVAQAQVALRLKEAALFARLDYRVTGIDAAAATAMAGEPVKVTVQLKTTAAPGRHVVHLEVTDPGGNRSFFLTRNVELTGGRWDGTLPSALNDPAGTWRIVARDVTSGMTAETTFTLKPNPAWRD